MDEDARSCQSSRSSQAVRRRPFTPALAAVQAGGVPHQQLRGKRCDFCGRVMHLSHPGVYGYRAEHRGHWFCSFACCHSDVHGSSVYGKHAPLRNQHTVVYPETLPTLQA